MYSLLRRLLFALPPETAHAAALGALAALPAPLLRLGWRVPTNPRERLGLRFPNPVGLAAGWDKDGRAIEGLAALGFGFVEVGTVTPRAQPGNPRPRLFRLPEHEALINRMGFNNEGMEALARRLERLRRRPPVLGINIGRNKDTPNAHAAADYLACLERLFPYADYFAVNVSSPNTEGLRGLQSAAALRDLAAALLEARERLSGRHHRRPPLLLKLAPDLAPQALDEVAATVRELRIEGLILTNTTTARPGLKDHPLAAEAGGLSGRPLRPLAEATLRALRARLGPEPLLIGVGGIVSGEDARARFEAGADLIQLYTGLVYRGPALLAECVRAAPTEGAT